MISGCIITTDGEGEIAGAIKSLKRFSNEVVVVDGGSKDKTVPIAEEMGAKVYYRKWNDDFGAQRNYAIEKSTGDWIFMLDTDERVTKQLASRIIRLVGSSANDLLGYNIPRKNYINGKLVESDAKLELQPRLFRRSERYINVIHEKPANADKFEDAKFGADEFIIHNKDYQTQKKHLLFQKKIMQDELEKAKRNNDMNGVRRMERLLEEWDNWWMDTQTK